MRSRTILAILCVAVVNAAGCGGGTEHETVNPERMLDAAAAHPIASAQTDIDLHLEPRGASALPAPVQVKLDGPYVSGDGRQIPRFDWRLKASALGFPVGGQAVSTGTNAYLSLYGDNYEVGTDAVAGANARIAEAEPVHPRSWFGRARAEGQGHEGDADCERISAPLRGDAVARDIEPLLGSLGLSETPSVSGTASACVGYDDRILHQLGVRAVVGLRPGSSVAVDLDVEISDVGEPQEISIPAGGGFRPIRDLALQLNDLGVSIPLG